MFDVIMVASMLKWNVIDGEMWRRRMKKNISQEQYDEYSAGRDLVRRFLKEGSVSLTKDETKAMDKFVVRIFSQQILT